WVGFPLANVIKRCEPNSKAKYVEFTTINDPKQMPGMRSAALRWPYMEGLRMDEAMHPLTILAVGVYGEVLPNQNGAPLRLVVPWKYGFKSIKAIVKIRFTEKEPLNTWQEAAPSLYGFYSNVNPSVGDQAYERRLGEFLKRKTVIFNGYGDQVASLYAPEPQKVFLARGEAAVELLDPVDNDDRARRRPLSPPMVFLKTMDFSKAASAGSSLCPAG